MRTSPAVRTLAALAALLVPALAAGRPTLAARLALAPALGEIASGMPMGDGLQAQLPLQLDALWRLGAVRAGGYLSWGPGRVSGDACGDGADCSGASTRAGVQGTFDFRAVPGWPETWAGAGVGWEWTSWRRERLGSSVVTAFSGPEAFVQGGAEWRVAERFRLGPFVLLAAGRYRRASLETDVASASTDVGARAFHAWIHVGVRGRVDL